MASMKRPRFKALKALPGHRLKMVFIDGTTLTVNFLPLIEESPGLTPLCDEKAFSGVALVRGGWAAEWTALDIQVGADTLWLDAKAQNAPDENTRIFAAWRARHGLSLAQAAQALGMTARTMSAYGGGGRPVPRHVALACKGWEAERSHAPG